MGRVRKLHYSVDSIGLGLKKLIDKHKLKTEKKARVMAKTSRKKLTNYLEDIEGFTGGNDAIINYIPNGKKSNIQIFCANSYVNDKSSPFSNISVPLTGRYVLIPPRTPNFNFLRTNREREIENGSIRENDTEYKLLRKVSSLITNNKQVGKINLYTYYEPCLSCDYVIIQFINLYPNIKINVYYEEEYRPKKGVI